MHQSTCFQRRSSHYKPVIIDLNYQTCIKHATPKHSPAAARQVFPQSQSVYNMNYIPDFGLKMLRIIHLARLLYEFLPCAPSEVCNYGVLGEILVLAIATFFFLEKRLRAHAFLLYGHFAYL